MSIKHMKSMQQKIKARHDYLYNTQETNHVGGTKNYMITSTKQKQ